MTLQQSNHSKQEHKIKCAKKIMCVNPEPSQYLYPRRKTALQKSPGLNFSERFISTKTKQPRSEFLSGKFAICKQTENAFPLPYFSKVFPMIHNPGVNEESDCLAMGLPCQWHGLQNKGKGPTPPKQRGNCTPSKSIRMCGNRSTSIVMRERKMLSSIRIIYV